VTFPLSDRVLAAGYLAGLDDRPVDDIRAMRRECEEAEVCVSFARRVLQGHLDIVESELRRRGDGGIGGSEALHDLVGRLPEILADDHDRTYSPSWRPLDVDPELPTAELLSAIDAAVGGAGALTDLDSRNATEVDGIAERLRLLEREFSHTRRQLHERIDLLKTELTGRYERGEVTVEGLLG
jgi:hypothetical protein